MPFHFIPVQSSPVQSIPVHSSPFQSIPVHYITFHSRRRRRSWSRSTSPTRSASSARARCATRAHARLDEIAPYQTSQVMSKTKGKVIRIQRGALTPVLYRTRINFANHRASHPTFWMMLSQVLRAHAPCAPAAWRGRLCLDRRRRPRDAELGGLAARRRGVRAGDDDEAQLEPALRERRLMLMRRSSTRGLSFPTRDQDDAPVTPPWRSSARGFAPSVVALSVPRRRAPPPGGSVIRASESSLPPRSCGSSGRTDARRTAKRQKPNQRAAHSRREILQHLPPLRPSRAHTPKCHAARRNAHANAQTHA